jgi:hypothetical protein
MLIVSTRVLKLGRGGEVDRLRLLTNPVKDNFEFELSSSISSAVEFQVVDNSERIVWKRSASVQKGATIFRYDGFSRLSRGIYFLSVTCGTNKNAYVKFLKN